MKRMIWSDIVKNFPDKYVALLDIEFDGASILEATVVMTCPDDEIGRNDTRLRQEGVIASWIRTTALEGDKLYVLK